MCFQFLRQFEWCTFLSMYNIQNNSYCLCCEQACQGMFVVATYPHFTCDKWYMYLYCFVKHFQIHNNKKGSRQNKNRFAALDIAVCIVSSLRLRKCTMKQTVSPFMGVCRFLSCKTLKHTLVRELSFVSEPCISQNYSFPIVGAFLYNSLQNRANTNTY